MKEIVNAAVGGIPLLFVVLGLVVYFKKWGVKGRWLLGVSMTIGLLFGVGYQLAVLPAKPAGYGEWFAVIFFGLALGLVASGIYDIVGEKIGQLAALLQRNNSLTALQTTAAIGQAPIKVSTKDLSELVAEVKREPAGEA